MGVEAKIAWLFVVELSACIFSVVLEAMKTFARILRPSRRCSKILLACCLASRSISEYQDRTKACPYFYD